MVKFSFLVFILILYFGFQANSCKQKDEIQKPDNTYGEIRSIGSGQRTSLVLFFKKGTSPEQKEVFHKTVLSVTKPGVSGDWTPPGVSSNFMIKNGDYEGQGVNFDSRSTVEQRENLKKAIKESPIVYRVYENVIPNEIKDL